MDEKETKTLITGGDKEISDYGSTGTGATAVAEKQMKGPMLGTGWWVLTIVVFSLVAGLNNKQYNVLNLMIGVRAAIALSGYIIMQIGLWQAEFRWDEEGSAAYLEVANKDKGLTPEELDAMKMDYGVEISDDKKKAAFPTPWGFLIGWWVWGVSYLFPVDGTGNFDPTYYGIIALVVCVFVSFVASLPMADAVMTRNSSKKKILSLVFLLGWITLGIMSSLDVTKQLDDSYGNVWVLCIMGPFTIILSQKILFEARKMGTLWEESGKPNFHPIVYNMGGPLFVWGWFMFFLGTCAIPGKITTGNIYNQPSSSVPYILPFFLNWRTLLAFGGGCAMVPVVRFVDYSHDEDGPWCGENNEGKVFSKWWLGTDGTYFGLFLESPWPFIVAWSVFGFSSFLTVDNRVDPDIWAILMLVTCVLQAVDAGILIQQNLYAGNMAGKTKFSIPFVILFILLALNIGQHWNWRALSMSLPGAILIILGQRTVFGARKRGDYTMLNEGSANPYDKVFVYSWGEVFFMLGWIIISWAASFP